MYWYLLRGSSIGFFEVWHLNVRFRNKTTVESIIKLIKCELRLNIFNRLRMSNITPLWNSGFYKLIRIKINFFFFFFLENARNTIGIFRLFAIMAHLTMLIYICLIPLNTFFFKRNLELDLKWQNSCIIFNFTILFP